MYPSWTPRRRGLGWTVYAWLVYLVFFFAYAAVEKSVQVWVLSLLAVAAFLPLYLRGFHEEGRRLLAIAWAIFIIGALIYPINPAGSCFFIYATAFVGFTGRPRTAAIGLAVMLAAMGLVVWLMPWTYEVYAAPLVVAAVVGGTNIHFAELRRKGDELRVAKEAVVEMARIAERERIGRDLHDLLGHTLSVIVLKSELASKLADRDPARAVTEIRDVERISREALSEVRKAVRGFRSEGLPDALGNAERVLVAAGVRPILDADSIELDADEERVLAFALREAVTNVIRHARAQHCWISLRSKNGRAVLEVRDDGCGGMAPEGSGLSGMRDRLRQVAGTLERSGDPGTRLLVTLPQRGTAHGARA